MKGTEPLANPEIRLILAYFDGSFEHRGENSIG